MSNSTGILHRTRKKIKCWYFATIISNLDTALLWLLQYNMVSWRISTPWKAICKAKKAIRAITFAKWNAHTERLFANLWLLKLHDINVLFIVYQKSCFVYKSRHGLLPPQFCNLFVLNIEVHLHDTRNKNLIHQVAHRINARALSIRVYGMKIWNALPTFIQNSLTSRFKKKISKTYLLLVFLYKTSLLLVYYFTSCHIVMLSRLSYIFLPLYSLNLNYAPVLLII